MKVITDNVSFANEALSKESLWQPLEFTRDETELKLLTNMFFQPEPLYQTIIPEDDLYSYMFITNYAIRSQYDQLCELSKSDIYVPDGLLCLAGTGKNFHGFHNRTWLSLKGNLHLSLILKPNQPIENFSTGLIVLGVLSVCEAIEQLKHLQAKPYIKWVNDIVIEKNKIGGILTSSATQGQVIKTVVYGIGINVVKTPEFVPDLVVPKASCLQNYYHHGKTITQNEVLFLILKTLKKNYQTLLNGNWQKLLNKYKSRSYVIGNQVILLSDKVGHSTELLMSGEVADIGDSLELYFKGYAEPISTGRIALK